MLKWTALLPMWMPVIIPDSNINLLKHIRLYSLIICLLIVHASVAQKRKPAETKSESLRLREAEFAFTEGQKFFVLEDYSKALLYFQKAAELAPENATIHYKIAEVWAKGVKDEDQLQAAVSIENALRLEKKNKYFYLLASTIYAGRNQFDKATAALETMLKEVKGTEEHLFELAALYLYAKREDDALKTYTRAEAALGISEISSLQKQRIYLDKGKINDALAEGEKLMLAFPDEPRYAMGYAELLAQTGNRNQAITTLEKYLYDNNEAGSVKMLLAGLYRDSGQQEKSHQLVWQVIQDPQVNLDSKLLMVSTYSAQLAQKNSNPSLEKFLLELIKRLETDYPTDANVNIVAADVWMSLHRNDEAILKYRQAVHGGTSNYEAWQNLLYLESQTNQLDSLLHHAESALELFPNQSMVYYFHGFGLLKKKQYREAAYALEQAKKLSASNPAFVSDLNTLLGDCYNGAKEYSKSDKAYEEALAYNPGNDIVLNNYSYYLALRGENLDKAEKMAAQLIKAHPTNSSYLDTYAWVLFTQGKYKEARKIMEKVVQGESVSATHWEHYGDILFKLGEVDNAVKHWQKARESSADHTRLDKKINNRRLN
ncbi:MAG: tetratricopeptide repeat protein [Cyclobacteriaceae bacterium]|nr:tetratricopeptide repeat protein [Cyclobacteriaceae bacterium]